MTATQTNQEVRLSLWEKGGKRRVYINHPEYSALKVFVDSRSGPAIQAPWGIGHDQKMLIAEKLEPYFLQAEQMLAS